MSSCKTPSKVLSYSKGYLDRNAGRYAKKDPSKHNFREQAISSGGMKESWSTTKQGDIE